MTAIHKRMLKLMLDGGCISAGYRILDKDRNPVMRVKEATFRKYKHLFRKSGIVYLINKSKVRQEHGNTFIKKQYKSLKNGTGNNKIGA